MPPRFMRERNMTRSHQTSSTAKSHPPHGESPDVPARDFDDTLSKTYKKMCRFRSARTVILTFLVVVVLGGIALFSFPRFFSLHFDLSSLLTGAGSSVLSVLPGSETTENADVLILGRGGRENDAPDLTDSIIVAHFDAQTKSVVTVSIPRDLIVQSDILGKVKINELYSGTKGQLGEEAAMNHMMGMVSQITGRDIRMYMMIDFDGFRKAIDAVGGIEIDVPERLYDPEYPAKNWEYTVVDIPAGLQQFDGDKALKYARSRHTTSDFDRSIRQQRVLQALKQKLTTLEVLSNPKKIESLYKILVNSITTNLNLRDIVYFAKTMLDVPQDNINLYTLDVSCFEAMRLCHPGGLLFTPDKELYGGLSVLIPKKVSPSYSQTFDTIRNFVTIITGYPLINKDPGIGVVNATGRSQLALMVALKLKSVGIPIDEAVIANQSQKSDITFIRYNAELIKPDNSVLRALASVYSIDNRPATPEEITTMKSPYELVLGKDSSLYFQ